RRSVADGGGGGPRRARGMTAPAVSLVLVAYRSSAVLPAAVDAFRRELQRDALHGEVIVVDHSEDEAEAQRLAVTMPDQLLQRPNRGYAAGINAGMQAAS